MSCVPQGTVLGPTLFLLFINDLPDTISSNIKLFTDDCVSAQSETTAIFKMTFCVWQYGLQPAKKCLKMTVTLKKSPSVFQCSLCNVPLEGVSYQKYLGAVITITLNWNTQCKEVKK